jgi:RNA polymerase sigma-70 factor (ECF subfamily)
VRHPLAKLEVEGLNPFARSSFIQTAQHHDSDCRLIPLFGGIACSSSPSSTSSELPPEVADGAIWSVMMATTTSRSARLSDDGARPFHRENGPTIATTGLAELHRIHWRRLLRFFARHGARQDAADLVQESFVRLAGARAKGSTVIEKPEAYLSTIASNLLRDRARIALSRSLAWHIPTDEVPLAAHDPIATLEARDQLERLQASLARLSPKTRSIFLAHRIDGMSYKDIANQTGLSVKAVERHMAKAIAHIDRVLRAR